jgi:hypothetical protein
MTKLLEAAIAKIRELPESDQDAVAEAMFSTVYGGAPRYHLTPEQVEEVKLTIQEVREGKIATDEEMAALWKKCGL